MGPMQLSVPPTTAASQMPDRIAESPSRILYAEDAHAMLLLTQGPRKPNRSAMLDAGRLLRIRGTKKGLRLALKAFLKRYRLP